MCSHTKLKEETMKLYVKFAKIRAALVLLLPPVSSLYIKVAFDSQSLPLLYVGIVMTLAATVFATLFCVAWYNAHCEARMRSRHEHPTYAKYPVVSHSSQTPRLRLVSTGD
jgi:hypothetical protein